MKFIWELETYLLNYWLEKKDKTFFVGMGPEKVEEHRIMKCVFGQFFFKSELFFSLVATLDILRIET